MVKLLPFLTCLTIINAYDYDCNNNHSLAGLETLAKEYEYVVTIENCSGVINDKTFKGFPQMSLLMIGHSDIEEINTTLPITRLWVSHSHFPNLDEVLQQKIPNLQYLTLISNKDFQVDPHNFNKYKKLTRLESYNTNFTEHCITKEWFQGLDLQELSLTNSNLTCISKDAFNSLKNLEKLNLWYNHISNFERETFEKLTKLEKLSIYVHDIENLDLNTFANQKNSLTELSIPWIGLKQNKISAEKLMKAFPKLKGLNIAMTQEVRNNIKMIEFCQTVEQNGADCFLSRPYLT